jgi:hypothetical protein
MSIPPVKSIFIYFSQLSMSEEWQYLPDTIAILPTLNIPENQNGLKLQ